MSKNMRVVGLLLFYAGISLAWLKTAEVLALFGPRSIFGLKDSFIPTAWGFFGAALVEGVVAVAFHNLWNIRKDAPTRGFSWVVVYVAALFSLSMNGLDTFLNMGWANIEEGSAPMLGLRLLTIAIPIVAFMAFGTMMAIDEKYPDYPQRQKSQYRPQQQAYRPERYQAPVIPSEESGEEEFMPIHSPVNPQRVGPRPPNGNEPLSSRFSQEVENPPDFPKAGK